MDKTTKELFKELSKLKAPVDNIGGVLGKDLNDLQDKIDNNIMDFIEGSSVKEDRNDFNISELFESGLDFQYLLNLCNKIIEDFGGSLKKDSAIEGHVISSDHIKTDLDRILEIELKNIGLKVDRNDLIDSDYKLLSDLLENKNKNTEFFNSVDFKKFIKSKFELSEKNSTIEELNNINNMINKNKACLQASDRELEDTSTLLNKEDLYSEKGIDMDTYTLNNINKGFKTSTIENYWLENRETMFKNIPKGQIEKINDLISNKDPIENKVGFIFQKFSNICKIEDGKLILDINNMGEILSTFKDMVKDISPEQVSVMGSIIPVMGTFMFYRKVSNLFADQMLRQEKVYLAHCDTRNKIVMNNYLNMVSENRVKLIIFNILACFCIGGLLSAYIVTINRNLKWDINIPNDTENKKSILPLFLLNRIKSIKLYNIGVICFFPFVVSYFSKNLIFISTIFMYLCLITLGFIIGYTLYISVKLSVLKHEGELKDHKLIKNFPFLNSVFLGTFELQRTPEDMKKLFINHYHGLIIFYLTCIIVLLLLIALWVYILYLG